MRRVRGFIGMVGAGSLPMISSQKKSRSFSVDFSVHENLIFSPQLVIWNYWPEDALYSPRRKEADR